MSAKGRREGEGGGGKEGGRMWKKAREKRGRENEGEKIDEGEDRERE